MKKSELIREIKSRLPATIDVLGVPFTIKFVWHINKEERQLKTYAWTVGDDREIVIVARKVKSIEQFKSTLVHELLHAALHVSGVTQMFTDPQEEAIVVCLEGFINRTMQFKGVNL